MKLDLTKRLYDDYKFAHPEEIGGRNHRLIDMDLTKTNENSKFEVTSHNSISLLDLDKGSTSSSVGLSEEPSIPSISLSPLKPRSSSASLNSLQSQQSYEISSQNSGQIKASLRVPPPPASRSLTSTPVANPMPKGDEGPTHIIQAVTLSVSPEPPS